VAGSLLGDTIGPSLKRRKRFSLLGRKRGLKTSSSLAALIPTGRHDWFDSGRGYLLAPPLELIHDISAFLEFIISIAEITEHREKNQSAIIANEQKHQKKHANIFALTILMHICS
jgi:hypothetical protein